MVVFAVHASTALGVLETEIPVENDLSEVYKVSGFEWGNIPLPVQALVST